jgi:hypothetical protein
MGASDLSFIGWNGTFEPNGFSVEQNGSFTYSKMIEIVVESNRPKIIYQSNSLIINNLQNNSESHITIFNSLGQLVLNQKIPANTDWFELHLPDLATGIYNAVLQQNGNYTYLKFWNSFKIR